MQSLTMAEMGVVSFRFLTEVHSSQLCHNTFAVFTSLVKYICLWVQLQVGDGVKPILIVLKVVVKNSWVPKGFAVHDDMRRGILFAVL